MKKRIAILLACASALLLLYWLNPIEQPLMPKCPFKMLTGLSCPGCGFQRATHAALHGHFLQALSYNYWFIFALPYLLMVIIEKWVLKGQWQQKAEKIIEHRLLIYTYVVTFFIWLVVRNIYGI